MINVNTVKNERALKNVISVHTVKNERALKNMPDKFNYFFLMEGVLFSQSEWSVVSEAFHHVMNKLGRPGLQLRVVLHSIFHCMCDSGAGV